MINRKYFSRILGVVLTASILATSALSTSAEVSKESMVLTKSQAIDMALKDNINLSKIDISMNTLIRNFGKARDLSNEITELLDGFAKYKSEYEQINSEEFKVKQKEIADALEKYNVLTNKLEALKNELENSSSDSGKTRDEIESEIAEIEVQLEDLDKVSLDSQNDEINKQLAQFQGHKAVYISMGLANPTTGEPINLTRKDEYTKFIKARDIMWYSLQSAIQKVKYQKELVNETIKVNIEGAYDGILFAEEGLKLQKQLYEKQKKDYTNVVKQYENNQISELEKVIAEKELKKSSLELEKINRQVENGKIQLKQILGIDLEKEISLADNLSTAIKEPKDYDGYLSSALLSRNEVLAAKLDYDEKERTFNIADDYLYDNDYELMDARRAYNEAKVALLNAKKGVRENIKNAYLYVSQKRLEIDLASKKLEAAQVQYNAVKSSYEAGMTSLPMVWNVELGLNSAKMNYNNAIRDYKTSLNKLDAASKIGPQY